MAIIYGLILMATLLAGGTVGWLVTTWHHERVAAEHDEDEEEMTEFHDMYAAWAVLDRIRRTNR